MKDMPKPIVNISRSHIGNSLLEPSGKGDPHEEESGHRRAMRGRVIFGDDRR